MSWGEEPEGFEPSCKICKVVVDSAEVEELMEDGACEWGISLLFCSLDEDVERKAGYGCGYKSDRILEGEEIHGTIWEIGREVL